MHSAIVFDLNWLVNVINCSHEPLPLCSGSNLAGSSNRGIMFEKEENLCAQQKNNRALCALDKSANRLPRKAGHCSIPTTNRTKTIKQPHKTATQPTTYFGHDQLLYNKLLGIYHYKNCNIMSNYFLVKIPKINIHMHESRNLKKLCLKE